MRLHPECPWRARRCTIFLKNQYNTGIFSYFLLLLLPCFSSTCYQTNEGSTRNISEDWFSRIDLLHHLLDAHVVHDEEYESISSIFQNRRVNISLFQHRSKFFSQQELFLVNQQVLSWWFCLSLCSACKILHIQLQRMFFRLIFRNFCVVVVGIDHKFFWFMRNSDPRVSIISVHRRNFWSQLRTDHARNKLQLPIRTPWIHPFGCDASSSLGRVYSRQTTAKNCVRSAVWILHPYKIYSHCLVVKASQFVLHIAAIQSFDMLDRHSPKELPSWFHWAQLIVPSLYQVALIYRDGIHILHTFPQLLRKDWADLQKQLCEKLSQLFHGLQQNVSTIFHDVCFWVDLWTMEL